MVNQLSKGVVRAKQVNADVVSVAGVALTAENVGTLAEAKTGTQSVNPASIAAGAKGTVTITATGVLATDLVSVEAPATLEAGLVVVGFQVTNDTITVQLLNATAAPIDGAALTWKWKAIEVTA